MPVSYVRTMERQLDDALQRERLLAYLSGSFGLLALVLSFVGLFGVMSYGVAQRTREIGICMALGASRLRVLRQVLGEATLLSAVGIAIGLGVALAATRVLGSLLYGLTPHDLPTLAAVTFLLLVVALIAGYVPARRAAALDPTRAMRSQ
ncbi:MAG TPA: FtsX-like permease family protein [Gemmatimonadaceae bacterium]